MVKRTARCTEIKDPPPPEMKNYYVFMKNGEIVKVKANSVLRYSDEVSFYFIEGENLEAKQRTIAIFKNWDYFVDQDTWNEMQKTVDWGKKFESLKETETP